VLEKKKRALISLFAVRVAWIYTGDEACTHIKIKCKNSRRKSALSRVPPPLVFFFSTVYKYIERLVRRLSAD
jgi:hypothetical protein